MIPIRFRSRVVQVPEVDVREVMHRVGLKGIGPQTSAAIVLAYKLGAQAALKEIENSRGAQLEEQLLKGDLSDVVP